MGEKLPVEEKMTKEKASTGTPIAQAAREVGVPRSTVREWADADLFHRHRDGSVSKRGMEELRQLADDREEDDEDSEDNAELKKKLLRARIRERNAISRLREIELERESDRFVDVEIVKRDVADAAMRLLGVMRSIPQRSAMALECPCQRAAVVEKKLTEEVERAVAEMRRSVFLKPEDPR